MSEKYKVGDSRTPHFITTTVIDWVDLLTRSIYKDIVIDSLKYCRNNKGLNIHAYCIMTNHFHLIVSSGTNSLEHVMRDLKKHTSKRLVRTIKENSESRRVWMLKKFEYAAKRIKRGVYYKIWQDGFHPVELSTNKMIDERMEYLHNNPVKEGIVWRPEDYVYSSASYYCGLDYLMEIDPVN